MLDELFHSKTKSFRGVIRKVNATGTLKVTKHSVTKSSFFCGDFQVLRL